MWFERNFAAVFSEIPAMFGAQVYASGPSDAMLEHVFGVWVFLFFAMDQGGGD
jgi:hypothetical protein